MWENCHDYDPAVEQALSTNAPKPKWPVVYRTLLTVPHEREADESTCHGTVLVKIYYPNTSFTFVQLVCEWCGTLLSDGTVVAPSLASQSSQHS